MIRLYTPNDFETLNGWVTDPEILLQFSGTDFTFPITEQQIINYQSRNPDRTFYLGIGDDGNPYGFGEIIPQENDIPRLGRLLIGDPKRRGCGLGATFVEDLVGECKVLFGCNSVELYVWDQNRNAISCYAKVGFQYLKEKQLTMIHQGRQFDIYKMRYQF